MFKFWSHNTISNVRVAKKSIFGQRVILKNVARCIATHNPGSSSLFPERVDFPSRHIGPRDQDVVTMLDLLGYKVGITILQSMFSFMFRR